MYNVGEADEYTERGRGGCVGGGMMRRVRRRTRWDVRDTTYTYKGEGHVYDEDDGVHENEDRAERTLSGDGEHSQQPLVFE